MHTDLSYATRQVAQGIVAEQANCALDEALDLMRNTAEAADDTLDFVAEEVARGTVRFD